MQERIPEWTQYKTMYHCVFETTPCSSRVHTCTHTPSFKNMLLCISSVCLFCSICMYYWQFKKKKKKSWLFTEDNHWSNLRTWGIFHLIITAFTAAARREKSLSLLDSLKQKESFSSITSYVMLITTDMTGTVCIYLEITLWTSAKAWKW